MQEAAGSSSVSLLAAHLNYYRNADQPSGIIDETNCESCKVSSFGKSRSNEGTQSWFDKGCKQMYIHIR
jgi:hypothetical protein